MTTAQTPARDVTAAEFASAIADGARAIGAIVYWQNLASVRVPRATVRSGFEGANLGHAVARDPKPEALLNLACDAAARGQRRANGASTPVRIQLKGKDACATYAILMRRDQGPQVRYIEEATVAVLRETPAGSSPAIVTATDPGATPDAHREQVVDDVVEWFADLLGHMFTAEFSDTLVRAMDGLGALALRTGVYLVPAAAIERVRALKVFVEAATSASVTVWEVAGGGAGENAKTARRDARAAFLERLDELKGDVAKFTARVTPEEALPRSVDARLKEFRKLSGQVELWADILGDYSGELRALIAGAKTALLGAYLGAEEIDAKAS